MNLSLPVLLMAAIRHPFADPPLTELAFTAYLGTLIVLAVLWHYARHAAHRFNAWWYRRKGLRDLVRYAHEQDRPAAVETRPQVPGHVPQPRRRIPLRRLPMRPEFRNPVKTRKVR